MNTKLLSLLIAAAVVAACAKKSPEAEPVPESRPVRMADNLEAPIARGDCREATKRALAKPDMDVDKVPEPLKMVPTPIDMKKAPKGVADRNGWFNVRFHVLVDTLGHADMKTFAVDTTSHPWLGTSVKGAVAKWTFSPAEVAGCKVPRLYSLGISPKGKTAAAPAKAPAKKKPPVAD